MVFLYRQAMADDGRDFVASGRSPFQNFARVFGDLDGVSIALLQQQESVPGAGEKELLQVVPVVHAGLVVDVLGNVPHDGEVGGGQQGFEHIVSADAEILGLVQKQKAKFLIGALLRRPIVDQGQGGHIVKIVFPAGKTFPVGRKRQGIFCRAGLASCPGSKKFLIQLQGVFPGIHGPVMSLIFF